MASIYTLSLDRLAEKAGVPRDAFMDYAIPREFRQSHIHATELVYTQHDLTNRGQLLPQIVRKPGYRGSVKPIGSVHTKKFTPKIGLATRQERRRICVRDGKPVSGSPRKNTSEART